MYSCKLCSSTFVWYDSVRRHVKNKHNDQDEEENQQRPIMNMCHVCNKTYTRAFDLRRHQKEKHHILHTEISIMTCNAPTKLNRYKRILHHATDKVTTRRIFPSNRMEMNQGQHGR